MRKIILILMVIAVPFMSDAKSFTAKYKGSKLFFQTIKNAETQVVCEACPNVKVDTLFIPGTIEHNGMSYQVKEVRKNSSMYDYWGAIVQNVKVLVIEEGVVNIGESSFFEYTNLCTVFLPSTLKKIEDKAFAFTGIRDIVIPESVEYIGVEAFMGDQRNFAKVDGLYYRGTLRLPHHSLTIGSKAFATASSRTKRIAVSYFKILQLPEKTTKGQIAEWYVGKASESMLESADLTVEVEVNVNAAEKDEIVSY